MNIQYSFEEVSSCFTPSQPVGYIREINTGLNLRYELDSEHSNSTSVQGTLAYYDDTARQNLVAKEAAMVQSCFDYTSPHCVILSLVFECFLAPCFIELLMFYC